MDLPKHHIQKKDIDYFLEFTNKDNRENIYITKPFTNAWLFLYIFNNYKLNLAKISFRGRLTEELIKNLEITIETIDLYFPKINKTRLIPIIKQLLESNSPISLQKYWKAINLFINEIRGNNSIKKNRMFIDDLFETFEITWFLEEQEYLKLKADLIAWRIPEGEDYYKHIRKKKDLALDQDIVLKFNDKKDQDQFKECYLLHREIWTDFFLNIKKISPQGSKIINHLYYNRFDKMSKHYIDIAEKLGMNSVAVSNEVIEIRKTCNKLGCTEIILDSGNGSKILNPNLSCISDKLR